MTKSFTPISLEYMDAYQKLWQLCPQATADYTLLNLWAWADAYGLEWQFSENLCWIRQTKPQARLWAPVGAWDSIPIDSLPAMQLYRVPEMLMHQIQEAIPQRVRCTEDPDQAEYLYDTAVMGSLSGNRMHRKKNHVNGYVRAYGDDYRSIMPADFSGLRAIDAAWLELKETEENTGLLAAEQNALSRTLDAWEHFPGLTGGALYAENQMVAFCLAQALDERTMLVHFEKARAEYRGAYQAISYFFAKAHAERYPLLDREQDLGEAGLRKSKQSYYPVSFLRKYTLAISAA